MALALATLSPLFICANVFFFLSALWVDILPLKVCLTVSYVCLFVAAVTNGPIVVDGAIWALIGALIHTHAVVRLVRDELPVKLPGPDEEALWRFFFRRSGMERLEFREVLRRGRWLRVPRGCRVVGPAELAHTACVVVEGAVSFTTLAAPQRCSRRLLLSGALFPLMLFNIFGIYIGFEVPSSMQFEAWAESDVLLYTWDLSALEEMATRLSPSLAAYWRNMLLFSIASEMGARSHSDMHNAADGLPEDDAWYAGARSRDFTEPLRPGEQRRLSPAVFWDWLKRSVNPFPPPGMRHTALPLGGIMASNRVRALAAAEETNERVSRLLALKPISTGREQQQLLQPLQPQLQPQPLELGHMQLPSPSLHHHDHDHHHHDPAPPRDDSWRRQQQRWQSGRQDPAGGVGPQAGDVAPAAGNINSGECAVCVLIDVPQVLVPSSSAAGSPAPHAPQAASWLRSSAAALRSTPGTAAAPAPAQQQAAGQVEPAPSLAAPSLVAPSQVAERLQQLVQGLGRLPPTCSGATAAGAALEEALMLRRMPEAAGPPCPCSCQARGL